ncbi:MAG: carboxypeptidase-like regulatory domain-containing protein [Chitinophagales bacterium]
MKRLFTIFLCMMTLHIGLMAQTTITGTVTETDNQPLPGVNIVIKGTTTGTVTDIDGKYSIETKQGDILVFSFLGYENQERAVGSSNDISIVLKTDEQQLSEFVVTALGFKEQRDKMSSTYSRIAGDDVVQRGENKIIDGISGKASGVRVSGTSGDPGSGANIQIRGQNTITGDNQPLIIVDGVPFNNDWLRGDGSESDAGVTQQSRLNDLNPEDIESFQVYKGASAGALYGTRAMNGAIVITTKRGKKGKLNVNFSSNLAINEIFIKHPLQSSFGQGTGGNPSPTSAFSWGDKISERAGGADEVNESGQFFQSATGNRIYPITTKNSQDVFTDSNFDAVFQNGVTTDNQSLY